MKHMLLMCSLYITLSFLLKCLFVKYIFVKGGEINPLHMFEESNAPGRKRQTHERKLYNFNKSDKGKKLKNNLNILIEGFHEVSQKAEIKTKKNVSENEHHSEIIQYIQFSKNKKNIKELLKDMKEAVKVVYSEGITAIEEEEEIEDIKKDIEEKVEVEEEELNTTENKNEDNEEREEKNILNNKDEVRNAIALDNIIKLLKNIRESYTNEEYEKIINDKELLLEKLLRPDLILDEKEFERFYTGINLDAVNISPTLELLHIDYDENNITSFLQMRDKSSPNYCSIHDDECDRRKNPYSCESRLEVEDQKGCGSCWVFSGLHAIELSHCLASGKDTVYSRQEIIDCSERECNGGDFQDIIEYLETHKRLSDEGTYPYEAKKIYCRSKAKENVWTGDSNTRLSAILRRTRQTYYNDDEWNTTIKKLLVKHGAVVVYLLGSDLRYAQGVPIYICRSIDDLTHAAIITGWKILNGVPVWIIRNSWGIWWSDKGYAYIAMNGDCKPELYPIHTIHVGHFGEWSDKKGKYEVINTNTKKKKDKNVRSISIDIGVEKEIVCPDHKLLHIKKYHVLSYLHSVSGEKPCEQLDIKNKCENKQSCSIYFSHHTCDPRYNALFVEYECLAGLSPYDCTVSTSERAGLKHNTCVSYCALIASKCRPVTTECLYSIIDRSYCNFDKVPTSVEQGAQRKQKEDTQRRQGKEDEERREREGGGRSRRREADETGRRREEDEARRRREEGERRRREEEETRRRREEGERRRREEEETRRRKEEDETRRRREEGKTTPLRRKKRQTTKFDCTKAVTKLNSNNAETCVKECELYESGCSTTDCFYNKISKNKCDLTDVLNGFDCSKVVPVNNPGNAELCISHCKYYSRKCLSFDCLKDKLPAAYCDVSNVTQANDCNKAKALFIPDASVTHLCIEHCKWYSDQCDTLECLYSSISGKVCDLSKIV